MTSLLISISALTLAILHQVDISTYHLPTTTNETVSDGILIYTNQGPTWSEYVQINNANIYIDSESTDTKMSIQANSIQVVDNTNRSLEAKSTSSTRGLNLQADGGDLTIGSETITFSEFDTGYLYVDASTKNLSVRSNLYTDILGTTNQINVTSSGKDIILSTPQNIGTSADAKFNSVSLGSSEVKFTSTEASFLTDITSGTGSASKSLILDASANLNSGINDFKVGGEFYVGSNQVTGAFTFYNVLDYGATGDGVTDDSTAVNAALAACVSANGGTVFFPPGTYLFESQVTMSGISGTAQKFCLYGYGALLKTTGAISALAITGGAVNGGISVQGFKVDHRGNTTAIAGFEAYSTWKCSFVDCTVQADGSGYATYAAFLFHNGTASNPDTGCFWNVLDRCFCRTQTGGDVYIPYGVWLRGACNATTIQNCGWSTVTTGVYISPESGQTYISNGVVITSNWFEGVTTGIHADQNTSNPIRGLRVIANRIENTTTFVSLTGATTQPLIPTYIAGNWAVSDLSTYLNNPNSLYVNTYDGSANVASMNTTMYNYGGLNVRQIGAAGSCLKVYPGGGNRGIDLNVSGIDICKLTWIGTGTQVGLAAAYANQLAISGIRGLSGTTTRSNNFNGSATLSGGAANVTFATDEPDVNYYIVLSGNTASEYFYWSSKATTGFTITSSNGSSTAIVDWLLTR